MTTFPVRSGFSLPCLAALSRAVCGRVYLSARGGMADARQTKNAAWQAALPVGPCGFESRRAEQLSRCIRLQTGRPVGSYSSDGSSSSWSAFPSPIAPVGQERSLLDAVALLPPPSVP
jgi:hypothetical protein